MSLLQNSNAISSGGYNIANSLRFQSASSTYLARTPASATSRTVWTWSAWVKRGSLGGTQQLLCVNYTASQVQTSIYFNSDAIEYSCGTYGVSNDSAFTTSQVFRDPSAWYHLVLTYDSTQGTNTNRLKFYVNGSQVTAFSSITYPSSSFASAVNNTVAHNLGRATNASQYFDGYMTEINLIDGQALTPSSFGETNTLTGQWVAKKYTGTYGTNGFYLPFSNGTSTTTLGADSSGNSNNWTLTNFTRSAGVSDCWMYDVPSGNGSSVGGTQPNSNYCVLNPLASVTPTLVTNSNLAGNNTTTGNYSGYIGSMAMPSGKWYYEGTTVGAAPTEMCGVGITTIQYYAGTSQPYAASVQATPITYSQAAGTASGNVVGVAYDADAGTCQFYLNGVAQGSLITGLTGTRYPIFLVSYYGSTQVLHANFGQRSFAYTPPSGFKALCTANLPASTIVKGNQYMDATLWTGDGASSRAITNAGSFSPDFVWIKNRARNDADPFYGVHMLFNTVTGVGNRLMSQSTAVEAFSSGSLTAFNSNGFSVGSDLPVNRSGDPFVAWQWDAGSSTVTNTSGTISSQVRANPTAGVSVVTFTEPSGVAFTVGHGLGVAPAMYIYKNRNATSIWSVYHKSTGAGRLRLNDTTAVEAGVWTAPTSSIINIPSSYAASATAVMYAFAEIAGFSRFGSYSANGNADGPFNYTGFRPKLVMIKRTDSTESWIIEDSSRSTYNGQQAWLYPNLSAAEGAGSVSKIDFLSNGFKLRNSADGGNISGGTYIFMAFAENPFQNSNAR